MLYGKSQLDHYLPLLQSVISAGKRPMIYGDMILAHPEILEQIPHSVLICDWDYWSGTGEERTYWGLGHDIIKVEDLDRLPKKLRFFRKYIVDDKDNFIDFPYAAFFKEKGFDVVLMSSARSGGDNYCVPRTKYHVTNAFAAARRSRELNLAGVAVSSWNCRFNHFETNWPTFATAVWAHTDCDTSIADISRKFAGTFFGCDWPTIFEDIDLLSPELPHVNITPHYESMYSDPYPPNILHRYIKYMYQDPDGWACKKVQETLPHLEMGYNRGVSILQEYAPRIRLNRDMFDHWVLAAETLLHKAKAGPAIIRLSQGQKVNCRTITALTSEIEELVKKYKIIFGRTHLANSLQLEIDVRFKEEIDILCS